MDGRLYILLYIHVYIILFINDNDTRFLRRGLNNDFDIYPRCTPTVPRF